MPDPHENVPVLIVGGGPAGLSASLLLSRLGIESLLIERREGTSDLPKAQHLNLRTMEIFDVCGVADEIYEQGSPMEFMCRVAWSTSLTGPTDLHGREIASRDCWGGGADAAMSALASRYRSANLSQLRLEPLLKRHAEERETAAVRFGHELLDLTQDAAGVTATILDRSTEARYQVRSQYLVGADGGRTVGNLIGAVLDGKRDLVRMVSTHIQVDLRRFDLDPAICIYWFVNPDHGGSIGSGVLVKMGGAGWGPNADEWVFGFATTPDDPREFDADYVIERFRRAVGDHSLEVNTYRVSPWRVESLVADRYSSGRVFLAGDAAHRHPPTGALGLNAAVHDVHNLTWKLALVLHGLADPSLLDSYEAERKPVAQLIVDQALSSFFQHSEIDHAIGLDPQSPEAGWAGVRELFSDTPAGRKKRAEVDAAAERKGLEFSALNLEIGYRYQEGAVVAELEADETPFDPRTFVPSARAGARMPHAWVGDGINCRSTYDLVTPGRFTLFIDDDGDAWRAAAEQLSNARDLPLDVIAIGDRSGLPDAFGAWQEQSGVSSGGAVLVRPDHHVAWSTIGAVSDAGVTLRQVFDVVLPSADAAMQTERGLHESATSR